MEASDIVPVVVIGPPVSPVPVATLVTVPVPVMLLQPNPELVVQIRADDAPLQDGTATALGTAEPEVALPSSVLALIDGKSARTRARKVGVPDEPFGDANVRFWLCDASDPVNVPDVVTGDPDIVNMFGRAKPTDVTVPVPETVAHDGTPEALSERNCVPLILPIRLVHPDVPRYIIVPGEVPYKLSKNVVSGASDGKP